MTTNTNNNNTDEVVLTSDDIDELIHDFKNDLEQSRQQERDERWLQYLYPQLKKEAARIRKNIKKGKTV